MSVIGFINHARLAFHRNAAASTLEKRQDREAIAKNRLEKVGDGMLWHVTHLPKKISKACHDPRVLTVALTAMGMLTVQFAFYPSASWAATLTCKRFITNYVSWKTIKDSTWFATYLASMFAVTGTGTRALGRFVNKDLMDHFYQCHGYRLDENDKLVPLKLMTR